MYWVLELAQSVGDDAGLSDIIVAVADVVVAPLSPPRVSDRGRSTGLLGKGVGGRTSPWVPALGRLAGRPTWMPWIC
jgi:hypothetical protein